MKLKTLRPSPDSSAAQFERLYVKPKEGRTLIVGSQVYGDKEDRRKRYADVVGVDMLPGPGVDVVANLEEGAPDIGMFDHVECMSVLEHSPRPWLLAENIQKLMNRDATIFCTVPFVHRVHAYPDDYFRISPNGLRFMFPCIAWAGLLIGGERLYGEHDKVTVIKSEGHPYLARSETMGFGHKWFERK